MEQKLKQEPKAKRRRIAILEANDTKTWCCDTCPTIIGSGKYCRHCATYWNDVQEGLWNINDRWGVTKMEWSAEIAAREMWSGLDLTGTQGQIHAHFKQYLQAAYDAGFGAGYNAADEDDATAAKAMLSRPRPSRL